MMPKSKKSPSKKTFFQLHRSYIINLSKIDNIEEQTLVISKKMIPIAKATFCFVVISKASGLAKDIL